MRIHLARERGNAMLIMLVSIVVIGTALASYLDLVSWQNRQVNHSLQWNAAIPVLEAGLEEALTHLYHNGTNLAGNGWTLVNGVYEKERYLGENRYVVTMTPDARPTIISRAYMRDLVTSNFLSSVRAVKVTVTNSALFAKGMVAKGEIDLSGNGIMTDSFDSADENYSTNGQYDENKAKDNGDVATNSAVVDSLDVWNADIFGKASTGPGGTVKIGPNGSVGSKAWHDAGNKGIEPGWSSDDMNVQFPDVQPPFSGGAFTPASGNVGGTNYTYVLGTGNYQLSSLSLSGQNKVLINGNAVLYVTGNVSMSGSSKITIAPGASLNLYVGGASASIGGNGIINQPGNATNFYYWGLNGNTSLSLSGNAAFTGVIYAPYAAFSLGGGGSDDYDFVGASITSSVAMNGHFKFHYDENLSRVGPRRGFSVDSWNEIKWEEL
ncbi:MAG: hypothetical protein AB1813_01005 [Verrucomicrobiota bacterium]